MFGCVPVCVYKCVCMCVSDNEWKLPRPSTAGRRLRLSDVTVSPHCLLLIHQRTFFHLDLCVWLWLWWCVCISGWFSVLFFFLSLPFILDIIMSGLCLWQQQRSEQWSMSSHGCGRGDVQDPLPEVNSEPNWTRGRIKREAAEDVEIDISLSPASYNFVCLNKTIIWVRADFIKVKTQRRKHIVQTTVSSRLAASAWHNLYFRPHATSGMLQIVHNSSPALSRVFSRKCVRWNNSVKHRLQKSSVIGFFFRLMIEIKFRLRFFECVLRHQPTRCSSNKRPNVIQKSE